MAESSIHEELRKIQQKLKAPKNQFNKFGNYKYRSCEDILEAIKPLLPTGYTLTIEDKIFVTGPEENPRYYVKAIVRFACHSGEIVSDAYAREAESKKGMDEAQVTGAASSYARKYALNGLFLIDDTKDADTQPLPDGKEPLPKAKKTAQQKPQNQSKPAAKPEQSRPSPGEQQMDSRRSRVFVLLNQLMSAKVIDHDTQIKYAHRANDLQAGKVPEQEVGPAYASIIAELEGMLPQKDQKEELF